MIKKKRLPNEKDWRQIRIGGLIIVGLVVLLFAINDKNFIWQDDERIMIWSGLYFEKIYYQDIDSVIIENRIPNFKRRTNGFSAFGKKKGYFRRYDAKRVKLFIDKSREKCLHIFEKDGDEVYLNFDKDLKTLDVFNDLKIRIED